MKTHLFKALRVLLRVESRNVQIDLFDDVKSRVFVIRVAYEIFEILRTTPLSTLMVVGYGLKSAFYASLPKRSASIVATAMYINEQKTIEALGDWIGSGKIEIARVGLNLNGGLRQFNLRKLLQIIRIAGYLKRRYHFMPVCRALSTLFYYLNFRKSLAGCGARVVCLASANSPDSLGMRFAAHALGVPTVFVPHAAVPCRSDGPTLDFSLAVLSGAASLNAFAEAGKVSGRVIFAGIAGHSSPLRLAKLKNEIRTFGIFLTGLTDRQRLANFIGKLLHRYEGAKIVIRPHPLEVVNIPMDEITERFRSVVISRGVFLAEDIQRCDFVFIGNSSVVLETLKGGTPAALLQGIDAVPHDYYRFIENGVVPEIDDISGFDPEKICAFYEVGWIDRFRKYDYSYLRDQNEIIAEVRKEFTELVALPRNQEI